MAKIVTAREAVDCIRSNSTLALSGFCGFGSPDEVLMALRARFEDTGAPRNLTLLKGVSVGDHGTRGANRLAAPGLIGRVICGHTGLEPQMSALIMAEHCLAYLLPLGTITELLRAAAAGRPGVLTKTGLGTFADPRLEGSKVNAITKAQGGDIVSLLNIQGRECLFYETLPVDACIVRGTSADEDGNISLEHEALIGDQMEAAAAAHNSGGRVIVQVERVVRRGSIHPRNVALHHAMVDFVVVARPENHTQGFDCGHYRPELTGETRAPQTAIPIMPLNNRKICARRAAMELQPGNMVNLGIGMPDAVAAVAGEEGISAQLTLSIESGVLGGVPLGGLGLGASINPEAMYKMADMLNLYDGGGLDMAVLGLAQMDGAGNVNVSKFGGRVIGPGGFIDIAQFTPKVIFMGTFTAGGLKTHVENGRLVIDQEGSTAKFVEQVEQVTFAGRYAIDHAQQVLIVTERAVFRLTPQGLVLTEIAPGIELERDILAHMAFRPAIAPDCKSMDPAIFQPERMNLKHPFHGAQGK